MPNDLVANTSKGISNNNFYDDAQKLKSIVNKLGIGILLQEVFCLDRVFSLLLCMFDSILLVIQLQVEVPASLLQQLQSLRTSHRTVSHQNHDRKSDTSIVMRKSSNKQSALTISTSSCLVCMCENAMLLIEHPMFIGFKICKSCVVSTTAFIYQCMQDIEQIIALCFNS